MKKSLILVLPVLILGISSVGAQTINGQKLNIGSPSAGSVGTNNVTGAQAGAIGDYSNVSGNFSLSVGESNMVSGPDSLAVGVEVSVNNSRSLAVGIYHNLSDANSMMIGNDNYTYTSATAESNLFVGNGNVATGNQGSTVLGGASLVTSSMYSLVTGFANTATSVSTGFVAGDTNVANGKQFVIGTGLIAQDTTQAAVVLGQYNKTIPPVAGSPKPVLVVGTGTSSATANRSNALEVYTDGSVKLGKLQGDISGGEFVP